MLCAKHTRMLFVLCFALIFACWATSARAAPDLIVFLADDLGATDIGPQRRKRFALVLHLRQAWRDA